MTHYRMLDRAPSVVITSNRNELKVYQNNIVYLNNGENFELRFFNPLQEKIGVEIIFNGTKKGDGFLVLNPGQDITLDRFLDEQRKMLFETYTINGNNKEALKAAEKNGLITFNFYKEYFNNYHRVNDVNVVYDFPPKPHSHNPFSVTTSSAYYSTLTNTAGMGTVFRGAQGNQGQSGASGASGTVGTSYTKSITFDKDYYIPSSESEASLDSFSMDFAELETGRVEKGEVSNQRLKTVNSQFATNYFHTITYQMLPYSAKGRNVEEVRQYCPECRYRIRKETWKYCPKCGERL